MITRLSRPRRVALAGTALLLLLLAATPASAFDGDWRLGGSFARSTAPSFNSGFNPDDIDHVEAAYDNRGKQLSLTLTTFDAPSGDPVRVRFGIGGDDGSCPADAAELLITSQPALIERTVTETVWEWSPPQERRTWSYTWPGTGWAYAGVDSWSRMHRWIKAGTWVPRTVQRVVQDVDPTTLERTAVLTRAGIDGSLMTTASAAAGSRATTWTFGAPQLDGLVADCLAIAIPNRAAPFAILPVREAPPAPPVTPAPDVPLDGDEVDLEDVTVTATRRGTSIEILLGGGEAEAIGIRVRRASKTVPFRRRIVLRRQPDAVRSVQVRLSDGTEWSAWERIAVR